MTPRAGVTLPWAGLLLVAAGQATAQIPLLEPNKPNGNPSHVSLGKTAGDPRPAEALLQQRLGESPDKMDQAALEDAPQASRALDAVSFHF